MKTRPWPLVVLAFFQVISPIFNILVCSFLLRAAGPSLTPLAYLDALCRNSTPLQLFEFFALGPLAGLAIYAMKRWSYPVFLSITAWTVYANFVSWQQFPDIITLPVLAAAYGVNIGLVGYFLMPTVTRAYFDPKLRWWESKPRYMLDVEAFLEAADGFQSQCQLLNISEGGAFVKSVEKLNPGDRFKLGFAVLGIRQQIDARVVYVRQTEPCGYGIQFILPTSEAQKQFKRLMRGLELVGAQRNLTRENQWKDLARWLKQLARTGRGLVPEIQDGHASTPAAKSDSDERAA